MNFLTRTIYSCSAFLIFLLTSNSLAFSNTTDYQALQRFSQILDIVDQYYVEEVEQGELIDGAIKGMLESLDPHSTYMTAEEFEDMQESTSGEFFGIGAELSLKDGQPVVIAPIEDTPAFRAGIKAGDIIISVDDVATLDKSLTETVSMIRGEKGTDVKLVILSKDETKPKTITITRGIIPYISVKAKELEPGYLWLRLAFFNEKTTSELEEAIEEFKDKGPIKGIVLDMRNNPGGILNEAISVSDLFLDKGTIVSIQGRENSIKRRYSARSDSDDLLTVPLIVLINSGSASASEIVAGALSDNDRALLMGETTFGKGSVQNLIPLADGSGIKITIALYYTPNGRSIQAEGIEPNMDVPLVIEGEEADEDLILREKNLDKHLDTGKANGEVKTEVKKIEKPELLPLQNLSKENTELLEKDNQLRTALQVLKNMPDPSQY